MELNKFIDHTLLKPTATEADIKKLCEEAKEHNFYSVCINPFWVKFASECLKNTGVKVACVVGFPLGANTLETKIFEAKRAVQDGATELDMVMNQGLFKMKKYKEVADEIQEVCSATNAIVKVIVETSNLSKDEIIEACKLINTTDAHFIKTSTGFIGEGAKLEDVKIMKEYISPNKQVKASGGIRDKETALKFIEAGVTRLGTSSGTTIVKTH